MKRGSTPLNENDFVQISTSPPKSDEHQIATEGETITTDTTKKSSSLPSTYYVHSDTKSSATKVKRAVCPHCGLSLYTSDETVISQHINFCSANEHKPKEKKEPVTHPVIKPVSSIPPPPPITSTNTTNHVPSAPVDYSSNYVPSPPPTKPVIKPLPPVQQTNYFNRYTNQSYYSKPANDDSPFMINCPYCYVKMEVKDFYNHAMTLHSAGAQNYACPICPILGFASYAVRSDTNLLTHLKNQHADFANPVNTYVDPYQNTYKSSTTKPNTRSKKKTDDIDEDELLQLVIAQSLQDAQPDVYEDEDDIPVIPEDDYIDTDNLKSQLGSHYIEDVIKEYKRGVECTICFEEFQKGEAIARMDCFCTFHKDCIDRWFNKSKKCPLHKD